MTIMNWNKRALRRTQRTFDWKVKAKCQLTRTGPMKMPSYRRGLLILPSKIISILQGETQARLNKRKNSWIRKRLFSVPASVSKEGSSWKWSRASWFWQYSWNATALLYLCTKPSTSDTYLSFLWFSWTSYFRQSNRCSVKTSISECFIRCLNLRGPLRLE